MLVQPFPYTSGFFLEQAQAVREAVQIPVGLLGGVDSLSVVEQGLTAGFDFVVMGRALISDPDFVTRVAAGERVHSRCNHCNECVGQMSGGIRCVLPTAP